MAVVNNLVAGLLSARLLRQRLLLCADIVLLTLINVFNFCLRANTQTGMRQVPLGFRERQCAKDDGKRDRRALKMNALAP